MKYEILVTNLNVIQDIIIHLNSHVVDIVVTVVVHYSIGEHQHHVSLEFRCCTKHSCFHISLY